MVEKIQILKKKKILKKFYEVDYLNFDNSKNLNIYDVISFYSFKSII